MRSGETSDQVPDRQEIERMRRVFFRKTRPYSLLIYGVFAVMAGLLAAVALSESLVPAIVGLLLGIAIAVPTYILSVRTSVSARSTRGLVVVAAVGGTVLSALLSDLPSTLDTIWSGAAAGFLGAMIVAIVMIRRRLAHDDRLFLRRYQLGFDPRHPWRWLRG
jgi:hypothetical protein